MLSVDMQTSGVNGLSAEHRRGNGCAGPGLARRKEQLYAKRKIGLNATMRYNSTMDRLRPRSHPARDPFPVSGRITSASPAMAAVAKQVNLAVAFSSRAETLRKGVNDRPRARVRIGVVPDCHLKECG